MSPRIDAVWRLLPAGRARAAMAACFAAAQAACVPTSGPPPFAAPPPVVSGYGHEPAITGVSTRLVVGSGGLSLRRFGTILGEIGGGRFDALHLELRGGERSALRAVAAEAHRVGVDPLKITVAPGQIPGGGVAVTVIRFVATMPPCPSLAIIDPSVNDNDFEPTLGCSTRRNLAAMANDPADLLGNDAVVPSDGAAASAAIETYRHTPSGSHGPVPSDPGAAASPARFSLGETGTGVR